MKWNSVHSPWFDFISLFPNSNVTNAVPCNTISNTVRKALHDRCSVGEIKLPAALLIIMWGRPSSLTHTSAAAFTASGSLTSHWHANTYKIISSVCSIMYSWLYNIICNYVQHTHDMQHVIMTRYYKDLYR